VCVVLADVRYGSKVDLMAADANVCFVPEADIEADYPVGRKRIRLAPRTNRGSPTEPPRGTTL